MSYPGANPRIEGTNAEGQQVIIKLQPEVTASDGGYIYAEGNSTGAYSGNICMMKYVDKQSGAPYFIIQNEDGAGNLLSSALFGLRQDHNAFFQHETGYTFKIEQWGGGLGSLTASVLNTATMIMTGNLTTALTASRAAIIDGSSILGVSAVTSTELGYLSGATSSIQTQLDDKASTSSPTFTGTVTAPSTVAVGSANNRATVNKILYGATTDAATAVELTTDGAAGSGTSNRIVVPTDTAMSVVVNICVKQAGSANAKQMLRQFLISNNAGTTAIQGTVTTLGTDVGSAGLTTVTTTITANDTDDTIKIEVNGVAITNLRYTAYVVSTETVYA